MKWGFKEKYGLQTAVLGKTKTNTRREPFEHDFKDFRASFDKDNRLCVYDGDEIQAVHVDGSSFTMESEHYSVCLVLYRSGMENLKDLLGIVDEQRTRNDVVLLADGRDNEEQFLTLMSELKKKTGIKSPNVLFSKILEVADRHINELNT